MNATQILLQPASFGRSRVRLTRLRKLTDAASSASSPASFSAVQAADCYNRSDGIPHGMERLSAAVCLYDCGPHEVAAGCRRGEPEIQRRSCIQLELDAGRHFDFHLAHACGILVPESILYLRLDGRIRQGIIVLRGGNRDVLRRYAHADCGDYAAGAGP